MQTLVTVVGARPQFIKVAPVSSALAATGQFREILIHTGQHFDAGMSDVFFSELGIKAPDYNLEIHGGGHGTMTGAMLAKLEPLVEDLRPDRVLVYGDTNSTLAGALVAAKLHVPVAHVEAGLRSFNRLMPEEINRIVADQLSDVLFTSTETATRNLKSEGIEPERIFLVGDVMYDAALQFAERASASGDIHSRLGVVRGEYILATVHRAENTDNRDRLCKIVSALEEVAKDLPVILPLHPRTSAKMQAAGMAFTRVQTIPPVGYLEMVALESWAKLIATDSGGVQKEAFFYEVPCVTLRDETEWVELVELGWNRLAPPLTADIVGTIRDAMNKRGLSGRPYGDGTASLSIAQALLEV